MLAMLTESRERSFFPGGRFFVYGWCPYAEARSGPYLAKSEHPRAAAPRPVIGRPPAVTHSSSRRNFLGRIGERSPRALEPSGAVLPMGVKSPPWPGAWSQ